MLSYITATLDRCRPGRPDYLSVHQDWAVMSCTMLDGRTLYAKTFMRGRGADAVFTSVRMTYPTEQRQRWDSVAVAATKSLIPACRSDRPASPSISKGLTPMTSRLPLLLPSSSWPAPRRPSPSRRPRHRSRLP